MKKLVKLVGLAATVAAVLEVGPGRATAADDTAARPAAEDAARTGRQSNPRIMVVVPETLLGRARVPDPAGETELIRRLVDAGFLVIESSEVARVRYSSEMGHIIKEADIKAMKALCAQYHCNIFVAGEAFSEQVNQPAPHSSENISARARIEVKAFIVSTGEIIAANAGVGSAADSTPAIAGKTALQVAAAQLADYLLPRLKGAISEGRVRPDAEELWRQQHPPYLLYSMGAALGVLALLAVFTASLSHRRHVSQKPTE